MKLSDLNPSEQLKVLIYGDAGAGKTVFSCSFPGPVFVADFDGKVSSAAAHYRHVGESARVEQIDYEDYTKRNEMDIPFARWSCKLHELEQAAKTGEFPYKTVVVDSLTFYADRCMEKVMSDCPGIKGPQKGIPGLQHYGVLNPTFKAQLARVLALPCHVVVTAHIEADKDELSGEIVYAPMLSGKLKAYIPILFPEVHRAYAETKAGVTKFLAQTKPDFKYKVIRSQIPGIANPYELSYESLAKPLAELK